MRKLKITELNRISAEEFKQVEKLPLVVVLDDIRSLHNIGSVFRTSDAFRIECIYLCGITATPPHPEMHKTALGAEFTVDWKYVNNAVDAVDNLKNEGYIVYSVEQAEGSIMLDELQLDKTKKYAIVMGNEVKGVQQEVINHSDKRKKEGFDDTGPNKPLHKHILQSIFQIDRIHHPSKPTGAKGTDNSGKDTERH